MPDTILSPCPFCGCSSNHIMPEVTETSISRIYIICKDCYAQGPAYIFTTKNQLEEFLQYAIDGWNNRHGG